MISLGRLTVRTRLLLACLGGLVPILVVAPIVALRFDALAERMLSVPQDIAVRLERAADVQLAIQQVLLPVYSYRDNADPAERQSFEEQMLLFDGALSRLEDDGLVEALAPEGRRRPYRLTDAGLTALRARLTGLNVAVSTGLTRVGNR